MSIPLIMAMSVFVLIIFVADVAANGFEEGAHALAIVLLAFFAGRFLRHGRL